MHVRHLCSHGRELSHWTQRHGRSKSSLELLMRSMSSCIDPSNNALRNGEFRGSALERIRQQEHLSELLDRLEREELTPDSDLYAYLLRMSTSLGSLSSGIRIHEQISKHGLESSGYLSNLLLQMYVRSGSVDRARSVKCDKSRWGVIMWTNAIAAYAKKGHLREAVQLYREMLQESCDRPDGVVFVTVLGACIGREGLTIGRSVHACVTEDEVEFCNPTVRTALMNMYARCGSLQDARRVFESIGEPQLNVVMYTTMIAAYAETEDNKDTAVDLFRRMQSLGILPDEICIVATLNACGGRSEELRTGRLIHACVIESGLETNTVVATALLNMYGRYGRLTESREVFQGMERKDPVAWTSMLSVYSRQDLHLDAMQVFGELSNEGITLNEVGYIALLGALARPEALPDGRLLHSCVSSTRFCSSVNVGNAMIRMYSRCSSLDEALEVFTKMPAKDVRSWSVLCTSLVQHERCGRVLHLYNELQLEGLRPDVNFFVNLLQACATLSAGALGRQVHARIRDAGWESDNSLEIGIVNMYGKCGNLPAALGAFDRMSVRGTVAWTTIISGYAHHGHSDQAMLMFYRMQQDGARPDNVTLLCVLSVCSHAGLVERGCDCFTDITREFELEPKEKHFGCVVDLLGRSGDLEAAEYLMVKMPFEPSATNWATFLAACKVHSDRERGKRAAEEVIRLEPVPAAFVSLSNIYAVEGEWEQVERVRTAMRDAEVQTDPGWSSIEVNCRVHVFVAGDKTHPRTGEIYAELERLSRRLGEEGYVSDVLLKASEEDVKDGLACYHSEKLAIGFGLVSLPAGQEMRIVKNMRVCGDCHTAIKLISRITGREIFVRDSQRFHRFKGGECSCGDYW